MTVVSFPFLFGYPYWGFLYYDCRFFSLLFFWGGGEGRGSENPKVVGDAQMVARLLGGGVRESPK